SQDREALLSHHDVRRPRDQPITLPVGVTERDLRSFEDRTAVHPPARARYLSASLLPRLAGGGRRSRGASVFVCRSSFLRQPHRRPTHAHYLEARPRAACRRLPHRTRRRRLTRLIQAWWLEKIAIVAPAEEITVRLP